MNINRLMKNLYKIGRIGYTPGKGITRTAFSAEYYQALDVVKSLFEDAGLVVIKDRVGNIVGKRKGKNSNAKSILMGSHLDTVKNGGFYDGTLGVMAALEVINTLNDYSIETNHHIEIIGFNAEEGSEMGGTFGSRVMVGRQDLQEEGLSEKLKFYGLDLDDVRKSKRKMDDVAAYLELHIEQGGYLENRLSSIGVVDGIVGITDYKITITGESNHAGTTPMNLRKDPVVMLGEVINKIYRMARDYGPPFVVTIGDINVNPGAFNVIPKEITFLLEVRDLKQKNIDDFMMKLRVFCNSFDNYTFKFDHVDTEPFRLLSQEIMKEIEEAVNKRGVSYEIITSGAGHDAKEFTYVVPTGMIFIPSVRGISHSIKEYSRKNEIEKGTKILMDTLLSLDSKLYLSAK